MSIGSLYQHKDDPSYFHFQRLYPSCIIFPDTRFLRYFIVSFHHRKFKWFSLMIHNNNIVLCSIFKKRQVKLKLVLESCYWILMAKMSLNKVLHTGWGCHLQIFLVRGSCCTQAFMYVVHVFKGVRRLYKISGRNLGL